MDKKIIKESLFKIIITMIILLLSLTYNSDAKHKNYHLKTSIDYGGFGLLYEVISDNGKGDRYSEEDLGYGFHKVNHYGKISKENSYDNSMQTNHLYINFNNNRDNQENRVKNYDELKGISGEKPLVFSFPGLKNYTGHKADSYDYNRASQVGEILVTSLNDVLLFMRNNADSNLVSRTSLHLLLGKLSYTSEINKVHSFDVTVGAKGNTTTFKVSRADKTEKKNEELIPVSGLTEFDYVKIEVTNGSNKGEYSYFPWRIQKGYLPGQVLADHVGEYSRQALKAGENEYLTWGQLILQAMLYADITGVTEQDFASDISVIGQGLGTDLTSTISSVRGLLGLSSMSELVLNMGARPANYHQGVMSNGMYNVALTVYTLNLIISLTFIGFMIVKMLHQKMLSTTNIIAKTTLMEGIMDLGFVAVMLGFFAPMFEMLLELNFLIVRTFSYSNEFMTTYSGFADKALAMESMAGFIVSTIYLSIDTYINFVYLIRAIVVSFLFAIAPLIIVSYLWSPAQKNLVFSYFRELIGNIFMQSFHAITMTFFTAYNMTNMSSIEAIASAYCFVPITQLFRQLVLGNSGGFSEKIGGKLAGSMTQSAMSFKNSTIKAQQSKELFTAQAKYNAEIASAQKSADIGQAIGGGLGTVLGAVGGTVLGGNTMLGATIGNTVGSTLSTAINGDKLAEATRNAQNELGGVEKKHAEQNIGMGLAELGVGLGVSSFDVAGDRMMQSGMANVQKGAEQFGRGDAKQGDAGMYAGQAIQDEFEGKHYSRTIQSATDPRNFKGMDKSEKVEAIRDKAGGFVAGTVMGGLHKNLSSQHELNEMQKSLERNNALSLSQAQIVQPNSGANDLLKNLNVNHVKNLSRNDNNQFELKTNLTMDKINKEFTNSDNSNELYSAYEDYKAFKDLDARKITNNDVTARWEATSAKYGIDGFIEDAVTKEVTMLFNKNSGFNNVSLDLQSIGNEMQTIMKKLDN